MSAGRGERGGGLVLLKVAFPEERFEQCWPNPFPSGPSHKSCVSLHEASWNLTKLRGTCEGLPGFRGITREAPM